MIRALPSKPYEDANEALGSARTIVRLPVVGDGAQSEAGLGGGASCGSVSVPAAGL